MIYEIPVTPPPAARTDNSPAPEQSKDTAAHTPQRPEDARPGRTAALDDGTRKKTIPGNPATVPGRKDQNNRRPAGNPGTLKTRTMKETAIEIPEAEALEALRQVLREERKGHWTASANTKHGLKSDPFRQLERDGNLNAEFFLAEASRIMAKTSTLPAGQRAYISDVIDRAVSNAVAQRAAAAADKAAQKPAATKVRKSTTANKKPAKSNGNAAKSNKTTTKSNTKK